MASELNKNKKLAWLNREDIRPYVFVREENHVENPGSAYPLDWFPHTPLYLNPLAMSSRYFGDQIMRMETLAFGPSGMPMPRWVFYDCAVMPGFVAGYAQKTTTLPSKVREILQVDQGNSSDMPWTPISLFIVIPTMGKGEWVAHNLTSINALIPEEYRFYGLGFLSKAFALWHANIQICCGMTQWQSPAMRLHSHYGTFEILTAYTPLHSYAHTLTYRLRVDTEYWREFFDLADVSSNFYQRFQLANIFVDSKQDENLKQLQRKIENGDGPFFLNGKEIRKKSLYEELTVYQPR